MTNPTRAEIEYFIIQALEEENQCHYTKTGPQIITHLLTQIDVLRDALRTCRSWEVPAPPSSILCQEFNQEAVEQALAQTEHLKGER